MIPLDEDRPAAVRTATIARPEPRTLPPGVQAEAVIDLAAIGHNTRLLHRYMDGRELMAVVKADGFAHGSAQVARTALQHGASWIGVTSCAEALALRRQGINAPMLMWLYVPGEDLAAVIAASVDLSAGSVGELDQIAAHACASGRVAQVHLKFDTGLSRAGAPSSEWVRLATSARALEVRGSIRVRGVWSHLGDAEDRRAPRLADQLNTFQRATEVVHAAGLSPRLRHLANSAAILQVPEARLDVGRAGIALYGIEPVPGRTFGLRPAMTVHAGVVMVKRVPAGTQVSYGPDWRARRESTLALIPVGFADGVPRRAWPRATVWLNGVRCPIAGRVAMDQFVVDAGELPVRPGDRAVLFGPGDEGEPTAAEWAAWADTNPHEVLTGISRRVPRRYLGQTPVATAAGRQPR